MDKPNWWPRVVQRPHKSSRGGPPHVRYSWAFAARSQRAIDMCWEAFCKWVETTSPDDFAQMKRKLLKEKHEQRNS